MTQNVWCCLGMFVVGWIGAVAVTGSAQVSAVGACCTCTAGLVNTEILGTGSAALA